MKVLFRTCGGLGNQIFQYFYLFCILQKYSAGYVAHFHSVNYNRYAEHEFPYEGHLSKASLFELFLIKLRLPPLLRALGLKNINSLKFGNYIIIDGYYQTENSYFLFSKEDLYNSYILMQEMIFNKLTINNCKGFVFHLRIGDYFASLNEERDFIIRSLKNLYPGTVVISNKDDLIINDAEIQDFFRFYNLCYKRTSDYTSIQLLELFCAFEHILSSGSSLSFAASIFNNIDISMNDQLSGKPLIFFNDLMGLKIFLNSNL